MEHSLNRSVFLLQIHLSTPCHLHRYGNTLTVQCTVTLSYCCLSALRTCVTYVAASMQEAELNYKFPSSRMYIDLPENASFPIMFYCSLQPKCVRTILALSEIRITIKDIMVSDQRHYLVFFLYSLS